MEGVDIGGLPAESALLDCEPPGGPRAVAATCYPDPSRCPGRPLLLESLGVHAVCMAGPLRLPGGVRVLGKGHSATVTAAWTRWGLAAVKALRPDGKRESLEGECRALLRASRHGASPRPLACSREVLVVELVWGPRLEEALETPRPGRPALEAVEAARALDAAGILHLEIHRPWRSILYPAGSRKAVIVDLESASEGCGNVPRVAQAVARRLLGRVPESLVDALRAYKKSSCGWSEYLSVKKALGEELDAAGLL